MGSSIVSSLETIDHEMMSAVHYLYVTAGQLTWKKLNEFSYDQVYGMW